MAKPPLMRDLARRLRRDQTDAENERRSAYLRKLGFRVLRFWDTDMLTNIEGVIEEVLRHL